MSDESRSESREPEPAARTQRADDVNSAEPPEAEEPDMAPAGETAATSTGSEEAAENTDSEEKTARKKRSFLRELPVLLVIAMVLSLLIKTFLVQAFFIPSESMERTLHGCPGCTGDRILVEKVAYRFHGPQNGDIVVFRAPPSWEPEARFTPPSNPLRRALSWLGGAFGLPQPNERDLVKRVIAVGGQTVRCCDAGRVVVDGRPVDEPYVYQDDHRPFGPITVPRGRLWVMGDHRADSADSRFHVQDGYQGTIPVDAVIGRAFVIVWPVSRWNTLGKP